MTELSSEQASNPVPMPVLVPERLAQPWSIEPTPPSIGGQLRALWRHGHLFWPLTVRALFNVYRSAILGILWMAVHPLVIAIPAAFIVGGVFGVSVAPLPLPLFILSGMAVWSLFRRCVQWMTKSMNSNRSLLNRVYVPALMLLVAAISPGLFEFTIVVAVVVSLAAYYGWIVHMGWQVVATIPAVAFVILLAIGVSCFTAILNTIARDTWLTLRYALSVWMLATPIVYPVDVVPIQYRWAMYLNPLTAIVELFRWGLVGYGTVHWLYVGVAAVEILIVLFAGIWFFARQQNRLFDHL